MNFEEEEIEEEEEGVELKLISRPGLSLRILPSRLVEISVGDASYQLPGIALAVLDAFLKPRTIDEGTELLALGLADPGDRGCLDDAISRMLGAGILLPDPAEEPEKSGTEAPAPEVSHGYGAPRIHVSMLRDEARTLGYLKAIRECVCPDDVVLDIGTGTGVLAVAAAEAGARQVYAIEANRETARFARALIKGSPHRDRIKLIEGWSTEIDLPERCDLLVSEMIGDDPLDENILAMTADAIDRHLKPAHRLIPRQLDIVLQPVKLPRFIREREFFCERDISTWTEQYSLNFRPLLETCPPMTMDQIRPQEMKDWEFVSEPRVVASIDLTERSHASFDEQFEFQLGEKTADGMVVFFETILSEGQRLSTTPSEVSSTNHWLSPCHMLRSEFRGRMSIGYRFCVPDETDGAYLSNWPKPD